MKSMMKRALSMLMAVVMVVGVAVSGGVTVVADGEAKKVKVSLTVTCEKEKTTIEEAEYSYSLGISEDGTSVQLTDANVTEKSIPSNDSKGTESASITYKGVTFTLALEEDDLPSEIGLTGGALLTATLGDITDGASVIEIPSGEETSKTTFGLQSVDGITLDGASVKWSLESEVTGVSINETTGELTVGSTTADEAKATIVATLIGNDTDETVFAKVTKEVTCRKAGVTSSSLTTEIEAGNYSGEKTLVETLNGNFLTEKLCKDNTKVEITTGSVTPSCDINEAKTEATLTYTFTDEGSYAYKYNSGDEVEFTIDNTAPTADIKLTTDSANSKKTVEISNVSEEGSTVKIAGEKADLLPEEAELKNQKATKEYTGDDYNKTKVTVVVSDKVNNDKVYEDVEFIDDIKVKVSLKDGDDWNEITSETKSNTIGEVRYFANEIKLDVTGIPKTEDGATIEVKVGGTDVTSEVNDGKYTKTISDDKDKLESTSIEITYKKDNITKIYTSKNTLEKTYGVDIKAPEIKTAFNNVVENNPIYAKENNGVTTIYVKLIEKVKKDDEAITGEAIAVVITGKSNRSYNDVNGDAKTEDDNIIVSTECPAGEATTIDISDLFVTNDAGVVASVKLGDYTITKDDYKDGKYVIVVDRATPVESQTSPAHIAINLEDTNKVEGIYTGDVSFTIGAYDPDSGIEGIKYWVKNSNGTLTIADEAEQTYTSGTATLNLNENSEQNDIELIAKVTDKTGNISITSVKFNVDNYAPRANVSFDNNVVENDKYFNAKRTATITVTDLNFDESKVTVTANSTSNTAWEDGENANEHVATYTFNPGEGKTGEYNFSVKVNDKAALETKNESVVYDGKTKAAAEFIVDKELPTISYTETSADKKIVSEGEDEQKGIFYYSASEGKTFEFVYGDTYLDSTKCSITYTVNKYTAESNTYAEETKTVEGKDGKCSFILGYGDILTAMTISVVDPAGNSIDKVTVNSLDGFTFEKNEDGTFKYTGLQLKNDSIAPEVKITLPTDTVESWKNSYNDNYYYSDEQVVEFEISDLYINQEDTKITLNKMYGGYADDVEISIKDIIASAESEGSSWTITPNKDTYPGVTTWKITYKLTDGVKLTNVAVNAVDMVGNETKKEVSKNIVIDMIAPTVTVDVEATSGIDNFYQNGDKVFVNLTDKNKDVNSIKIGDNGTTTTATDETVTLTLTVNDKNIATGSAEGFKVAVSYGNDGYTADTENTKTVYADNVDNTFTYTATIDIPVEQNKEASFTLTVSDLAGNKPSDNDITTCEYGSDNGDYYTTFNVTNNEGTISKTLNFDRRRVSAVDDTNAPALNIVDPEIGEGQTCVKLEDRNLYSFAPTYTVELNDGAEGSGLDSFTWTVDDSTSNAKKGGVATTNGTKGDNNVTYGAGVSSDTVTMPIAFGTGESNDITLTITATDKLDNTITAIKYLAVDTLAPRVNVSFDNNDVKNDKYFKADRTATVTVTDLNFDENKIDLDTDITAISTNGKTAPSHAESWSPASGNTYTMTYTFSPSDDDGLTGEYEFIVNQIADKSDNTTKAANVDYGENSVAHEAFVIDKEAPTISYEETEVTEVNDGTIWYTDLSEKEFTFIFKDTYLDSTKCSIIYTINKYSAESNTYAEETKTVEGKDGKCSFTSGYGDILTAITISVVDPAGNELQSVDVSVSDTVENPDFLANFTFADEDGDGVFTYTGLPAVIDNVDPVVGITLPTDTANSWKNSYSDNYYYASEQYVTINISDLRIDQENTTVSLNLLNNGKNASVKKSIADIIDAAKNEDSSWTIDPDTEVYPGITDWVITYKLTDGIKFTSASVDAVDMATNKASASETKNIVIDMTAPTVTVDVEATKGIDNIDSFYQNGDKVFVNLKNVNKDKNTGDNGTTTTATDETVTLTLTVNDKNIAPDSADGFKVAVSYDGYTEKSTIANYADNKDNTFTYTATIGIPVEQNQEASFTLTVADLAGNKPVVDKAEGDDDIKVCDVLYKDAKNCTTSGNYYNTFAVNYTTGKVSKTLNFDRRRVSSANDTNAPTINIEMPEATSKTASGTTLYNYIPTFEVDVVDGSGTLGKSASGLASVTWTVTDNNKNDYNKVKASKGTVTTEEGTESGNNVTYGAGIYSDTLKMPISFGIGESNSITLTVTATDKLGNTITAIKQFAIDTVSPRVTYTIDKTPSVVSNTTSGYNGKFYFNEVRKATITVTDINFDSANTAVTIKDYLGSTNSKAVSESGWTRSNITYTKTIYFGSKNNDQDYTVNFKTVDLAKNETSFGYGVKDKYRGAKNANIIKSTSPGSVGDTRYKFTVDMVNPTLAVSYDNNDVRNSKYYKADRTATVTITERNFDDLRTENGIIYTPSINRSKGTNPSLSAFPTGGTTHSATINYNIDGDYSYTLKYKDLAGNSINPDTFTQTEFVIDKTTPYANIDVDMYKSFTAKESVTPKVTLTDLNFNSSEYTVTSMKLKNLTTNETVDLSKTVSSITSGEVHGVEVSYADLKKVAINDGIYTLTAKLTDMAGNSFETTKTYSVNRFGSTYYAYDETTKTVLDEYYNKEASTLKIAEINPDKITKYGISFIVGTKTINLKENTDFTVQTSGSDGTWKSNIYTINTSAFMEGDSLREGEYIVSLTSTDAAGHSNSNRSNKVNKNLTDNNSMEFAFVLDATAPVATIKGVEDNESYQVDEKDITFYFEDSSDISKVIIEVSDENGIINTYTLEGDELDECNGKYTLTLEQRDSEQTVTLTVYDNAGNEKESQVVHFYINASWLAQWFHNTPLFIGSIAGFLALVGGAVLLINKKKKKAA